MPFAALFISNNHTLICWTFSTSIIYVLNNFQIMNNLCYGYSITCSSGMHVCTLSCQKKIFDQHLKFRIPTAQILGPPLAACHCLTKQSLLVRETSSINIDRTICWHILVYFITKGPRHARRLTPFMFIYSKKNDLLWFPYVFANLISYAQELLRWQDFPFPWHGREAPTGLFI